MIEKMTTLMHVSLKGFEVDDERVYDEIISKRNLGLGESYMKGWWDHEAIDDFVYQIVRNKPDMNMTWMDVINLAYTYVTSYITNFQSPTRSLDVGVDHYDLGDEIYVNMLGDSMTYTCAYWKDVDIKSYSLPRRESVNTKQVKLQLNLAQERKLDLICRKLKLHPGMKVLDIGCGYGSFARYASEKYGVTVTGITISNDQLAYSMKSMSSDAVDYRFMDYRDLLVDEHAQQYDAVVSIGMIEHVGWQNYDEFMKVVCRTMKDDGLALVHSIVGLKNKLVGDLWVTKYIFPGGLIPSLPQLSNSVQTTSLVIEDIHNFGAHYDKTLMMWYHLFVGNLEVINKQRVENGKDELTDVFVRMWRYYLLSCAGAFRARNLQLYQMVLSKKGVVGGYERV